MDDASFEFEFIETEIDNSNIPTGINLTIDSSGYLLGDTISLESQLIDGTSGQLIEIDVKDSSGNTVEIQSLNTDNSGSISLSFMAQESWKPGTYTITASEGSPLWDYSTSESIQILKPLPEIIISPTLTTTESGDEIETYKAGDIGYFSTSLLSESASNVLVTVNVVDAEDTTLGVAFFKSIIGKGDSKVVLGFKIPEDAADGVAKIYVNTYTDWPDKGGRPISSELLSEVNIEGIVEETKTSNLLNQNNTESITTQIESEVKRTIPTLPDNIIPNLSSMADITQVAMSGTGNLISYSLPTATGGEITFAPKCTPKSNSIFPIGSTQVTCTAKNKVGNIGMTSFMVTVNPIVKITNQTLSLNVGKMSYTNQEPIFVTGFIEKITGQPLTLFIKDPLDNLVSIEQITPKLSGKYNVVLSSNNLWGTGGAYLINATYGNVNAIDSFDFELISMESVLNISEPLSLSVSTDDSAYVLGSPVEINLELSGADSGEPILLEILDPQNKQVLLLSLNTDSSGMANIVYQLESNQNPGIYSITATSSDWNFKSSESFTAIAQIPDLNIGDISSTNQNGIDVDSFEIGNMGYFQTPIISKSVSNVLITVNILDSQKTPLGIAYYDSQIIDDAFDIVLGLQIPEDATPGMATVYVNTYTDWPENGGVQILSEQITYIDIKPNSSSNLIVSTNSTGGT